MSAPSPCVLFVMAQAETPQQRKLFMFNMKKDIIMLKEIVAINPFDPDGGSWREVLVHYNNALKQYGLLSSCPSERTLTDRVTMLINKFNRDELTSLRASGTAEEVNERGELIREVKALKQEAEELVTKKKEDKKRKGKEEEETAKEIRKRAMEGLAEEELRDLWDPL
ncbi:uncharacterized protein LOC135501627 [Lineus longissimus]|uniref:uncharacterized protein LOC135501627 n=1 Tax=Lineus longissimus TaxID=88925 RepID=UPI00315D7907